MKLLLILLLQFFAIYTNIAATQTSNLSLQIKNSLATFPIKQVIIWGHPLHSHTHSYIHYALHKAFKSLQIPTYWITNGKVDGIADLANSLFFTEGQVDKNMPVRSDCFYILHNCQADRYKELFAQKRAIIWQVYTKDCDNRENTTRQSCCVYTSIPGQIIYMPWATDLLPDEIETNIQALPNILRQKRNATAFIGTIGGGIFGNQEQIEPFKRSAQRNGYQFIHRINLQPAENQQIIASAHLAPAIVGKWQQQQGYIPCRIFKNISYGSLGITNSPKVYELLEDSIIFDENSVQLAEKAIAVIRSNRLQEVILQQMHLVKEHHTYLNRIATLLTFFQEVRQPTVSQ